MDCIAGSDGVGQEGQQTAGQDKDPSERVCIALPHFFRHQDLIRDPNPDKTIEQGKLINLWNHLHFSGGMVYVHVHHPDYRDDLLVRAYPEPFCNNLMICRWPEDTRRFTENARILNIILMDGLVVYLLPTRLQDEGKDHFTLHAPDKGYILGQRGARRYPSHGTRVELIQDGFRAQGVLSNFSALSFGVTVRPDVPGSFRWFNAESPSTIHFFRDEEIIFSASCRCVRQTTDQDRREIIFAPTTSQMHRFLKKKLRNPRVRVTPLPNIAFSHPVTKKNIQLDIRDLSTSGFAVHVSAEEDVLMPGMIIPDLTMNFSGALKIRCKAQAIYRRVLKKSQLRYGFVILDMDVVTYNRLCHIIMNTIDPNTHIADEVDGDCLWEFLFESGFIYPKKYALVQAYREPMKETYRKLYHNNPEIIAQMTYQWNGKIYGHVSMVRSYERAWMVHHLAAKRLGNKRTGLQILRQIIRYFDGLYRLPKAGMDYLMFYFRPENRFPDHFFGGFARHVNNPRVCSVDLFSYLSYPVSDSGQILPEGWSLKPQNREDLEALNLFYRRSSGGLLLDALHLEDEMEGKDSLQQLYARNGFIRSCRSFSLKQDGQLKAVLIVNRSDPGLSLSDFLNGIKILISDDADLSWEILSAAVSQLTDDYRIDKIPILLYPSTYLESKGVSQEKRYNLWIMDNHYGLEYGEFMMEKSKLRIRFLIRFLIRKYMKR